MVRFAQERKEGQNKIDSLLRGISGRVVYVSSKYPAGVTKTEVRRLPVAQRVKQWRTMRLPRGHSQFSC